MAAPRVIHIVPLGRVPDHHLLTASRAVRERFGCQPVVVPAMPIPAAARHSERQQLDADALLELLFDEVSFDVCRVLGITADDIFAENRNFVFGYAHMRDRVAIVSVARLGAQAQVDKAVVHELGHTFHAPHCTQGRCVMRQVEHLHELDDLEIDFCRGCAAKIRAAVGRAADDPECLFELAGSFMRRRRPARAVQAFTAACSRDPGNAHYANDLGVAFLALGERAAATQAFRRAIELAPSYPHAYYNLGIVFRERGDVAEADAHFAAALERDTDSRSAHRYLGILHQDYFFDPPRARAYLERYVALGGTDVDVRRRLRVLSRRGLNELSTSSRRLIDLIESTAPV